HGSRSSRLSFFRSRTVDTTIRSTASVKHSGTRSGFMTSRRLTRVWNVFSGDSTGARDFVMLRAGVLTVGGGLPSLRETDERDERLEHSALRTRQDARRHECLSASSCADKYHVETVTTRTWRSRI